MTDEPGDEARGLLAARDRDESLVTFVEGHATLHGRGAPWCDDRGAMDFPAAHSMDSTWFAVDADGYVAVFCTLEDGPLPEGASRGYGDTPLTDVYALECARGFDAGALDDARAVHEDVPWTPPLLLVFDGGHPDAARWLDAPDLRRLCDDPPSRVAASYPGLDAESLEALRTSPALRGSFWLPDGGGDVELEAAGVYVYEFAYEGAGVYARAGAGPERPRTAATMGGVRLLALPRSRFARDARVRVDDPAPVRHVGRAVARGRRRPAQRGDVGRPERRRPFVAEGDELEGVAEGVGEVDGRVTGRPHAARPVDGDPGRAQPREERVERVGVDVDRDVRVRRRGLAGAPPLHEQVQLGRVGELHGEVQRAVVGVGLRGALGPLREEGLAVEAAKAPRAGELDVEALRGVEVVDGEGHVGEAVDGGGRVVHASRGVAAAVSFAEVMIDHGAHEPDRVSNVDLHLLHVLVVVLETRSATRAAARLHVTQSAVSGTLRRARALFGDALFTREARGLAAARAVAARRGG